MTIIVAALVMLVASGLGAPASTLPPPPPTVGAVIEGLPADDSETVAQALAGPIRSAPVATEIPFTMVGFELPADAQLHARWSDDGDRWSPWAAAEAFEEDEGPDASSAEAARASVAEGMVATEPVWVGQARWLQVRVAGAGLDEVRVHLIDSMGLSRSLADRFADAVASAWRGNAVAAASPDSPAIVSRAEWGADESWRRRDPSVARRVHLAVVHHTATANDYTREQAPGVVRGIYRYHTQSLGWNDIGYNMLVDRFGTAYEGRAGGLEVGVLGAHAGGFNTGSFGISVLGTYESSGPPPDALETVARALAWKFDLHHVDAGSTYDYRSYGSTRYERGEVVRIPTVIGHRDVSTTSCPGGALYSLLPALRTRALELAGPMFLEHQADPGTVTVTDAPAAVRFSTRLRPEGQWELEVVGPDDRIVHSASGEGDEASSTWTPSPDAELGTYVYRFSAEGRRTAVDEVNLVPPVIADPSAVPERLLIGDSGEVVLEADLWPDAEWSLELRDEDGELVDSAEGTGERLTHRWTAADRAGRYTWLMEAGRAEPVSGQVEILTDVLERAGGGQDATQDSVALSRAAFPDDATARHVVLARADLFADAMAGGPLAGTQGPILLTPSDRLAPSVRSELERVLPAQGTIFVLGGTAAIAESVTDELAERWEVQRLAGSGRADTAAKVAASVVARSGERTALVARAGPDDAAPWADALAGGVFGAAHGIPVLLTDGDQLSEPTRQAIERLEITETIVLGGTAAVSDAVLDELPGARRVAGDDRAGTAAQVARVLWGRESGQAGDVVVMTEGYRNGAWALALVASPLGALHDAPLLLVAHDSVPPGTSGYLDALGYGTDDVAGGWLLGDHAAVTGGVAIDVAGLLQ